MKVMVALPTDQVHRADEFLSAHAMVEMSTHLEASGIDGAFVTDHPAPDDKWLAHGGHHAVEPTVALSFAAAATTTLRLVTNIYVLAYRNPLLAAKTLATLDVMSGGRLIVGVAAGYLKAEFEALGADFENRNDVLDESIAALTRAWTGESGPMSGTGWSARSTTILPTPAQQPHPPLWCGGNSMRAMRRAVTMSDGWMPFATKSGLGGAVRTADIGSLDALANRLERLDQMCDDIGRQTRPTIAFTPWATPDMGAEFVDEIGRLDQLGVEWITLTLPATSRKAWMDEVSALAEVVTASRLR